MERNLRFDWSAIVEEAIKRRKSQGLTQEKMAILAGVSKPTLNHFENKRTNITLENALKILRLLGLSDEVTN